MTAGSWRLSRLAVFAYFQGKFIINYVEINFLKHIFALMHVLKFIVPAAKWLELDEKGWERLRV